MFFIGGSLVVRRKGNTAARQSQPSPRSRALDKRADTKRSAQLEQLGI